MCGRTCLTLCMEDIPRACKYRRRQKGVKKEIIKCEKAEFLLPELRAQFHLNFNRVFTPSYNIAPTDITPVIVSGDHFPNSSSAETIPSSHARHVLMPMMWGMIPFWHKGDYRKHGLTTNNCRMENMLNSKLYSGPFKRGQRCVVLCEGFYEWQTTKGGKSSDRAAYFIHMPQINDLKIYDSGKWQPEDVNLLKMAGLFDMWQDTDGNVIYSYSVITLESSQTMSWLHHRMPAILETDQQVVDWLDFKTISDKEAFTLLRPPSVLEWYQVSKLVNNSRNKSEQCNKPTELAHSTSTLSSHTKPKKGTLLSWLSVSKKRLVEEPDACEQESDAGKSAKRIRHSTN